MSASDILMQLILPETSFLLKFAVSDACHDMTLGGLATWTWLMLKRREIEYHCTRRREIISKNIWKGSVSEKQKQEFNVLCFFL